MASHEPTSEGPDKPATPPSTKAAELFANLPALALTKHEAALFRRPQDYFRARSVVLELWMANPNFLTFSKCLEEAERRKTDSESDVRLKVETKLGMEPGTIKREKQYKAAFKDTVSMYLGDSTGVSSVVKAYQPPLARMKSVIVVGAGPAGLSAAMQLQSLGAAVTVLEARERPGGRVHTVGDAMSVPVDYGAQLCTGTAADLERGVPPDPTALLTEQLGIALHDLSSNAPLFDGQTGSELSKDVDGRAFSFFNSMLDVVMEASAQNSPSTPHHGKSLGAELQKVVDEAFAFMRSEFEDNAGEAERALGGEGATRDKIKAAARQHIHAEDVHPCSVFRRAVFWHWANLEYGCSADLGQVSLSEWNQDERFGAFGGPHAMVMGGYGQLADAMAAGLNDIRYNEPVTEIAYNEGGATVSTQTGMKLPADAVVVSVPIGVLQKGRIAFSPALPEWKTEAFTRIGMGKLNKVFLEFASPFWEEQLGADTQQFGVVLAEDADSRGFCSNFWNFKPFTGAYILCGLLTGSSAIAMENMDDSVLVSRAQSVLKTVLHNVPEPVRTSVTRWGEDPFAHGSYSFVGIGGRGDHYDLMARPIGRTLLFCGEGTSKEHLDTVGGAILTGRREAARLLTFFTANKSTDAERAATLAQHEGFLDPSTVVQNKDGGVSEDTSKVSKKPPKSRAPKERKPASGEKRKAQPEKDTASRAKSNRKRTAPEPEPEPEGFVEYAEITDKQLGDFFEYMDKFPQQGEGQLVRLLKEVSYPADMSQLLVCVNMAGQEKRDGIARSTACMNIFMSWTQVLERKKTSDAAAVKRTVDGLMKFLCNVAVRNLMAADQSTREKLCAWLKTIATAKYPLQCSVPGVSVSQILPALEQTMCQQPKQVGQQPKPARPQPQGAPKMPVKTEPAVKAEPSAHVQAAAPKVESHDAAVSFLKDGKISQSTLEMFDLSSVLHNEDASAILLDESKLAHMPSDKAEEFRKQISELKRKMDAVKSSAPVDVPGDAQVKSEDGKPAAEKPANGSPPTKRHKSSNRDKSSSKDSKLKEAVLKVVKQRLQVELTRGSITEAEYKDIAKRATNKVLAKGQRDLDTSISSEKEKKIHSLVCEYVSQAKKRRDL